MVIVNVFLRCEVLTNMWNINGLLTLPLTYYWLHKNMNLRFKHITECGQPKITDKTAQNRAQFDNNNYRKWQQLKENRRIKNNHYQNKNKCT